MKNLEAMNNMFELSQHYRLTFHEISSNSLSEFSFMLSYFERVLDEDAKRDGFVCEFVDDLRKFRFNVTASPLPFSYSKENLERIKLKRLAKQCGLLFPDLKEMAIKLVDTSLVISESSEKPILDFLEKQVKNDVNTALVVKVANNVDLFIRIIRENIAAPITIVSPLALKQGEFFEEIFIVGPPYWYPEHLYNSPRARSINSVTYTWQNSSYNRRHHLNGGEFSLSTLYTGCTFVEHKNNIKDSPKIDINQIESDFAGIEELIYKSSNRSDELNQVAATLVVLAGRKCMFFENHTIRNIWAISFKQGVKVTQLPIQQLDSECYLLIRTGTERDVMKIIADELLGVQAPTIRERHSEWKRGLQKVVYKYGYKIVIRELRKRGSSRANYVNLRNWMSEDHIKPREREDFSAIINILKYGEREKALWKEAEVLANCHLQAGSVIRKRLLEVVNNANLSKLELENTMVFPLPGAEEASFTAFKIEYIGKKEFYVDEHSTRTLLDLEGVKAL
jgi:hypothetical protein